MVRPANGSGGVTVPAVARAARVLEAVAEASNGLTLSAIARAVDAPKTSVLSICSTLVEVGYLVRQGGSYDLGIRVVQLGRSYLARTDIAAEFWRTNSELQVFSQETMVLSVLDGDSVVYVACRRGLRPVAMSYEIGLRLPAHCTASGKAMLAALDPAEVDTRYAERPMERLTDRSVRTLAALHRQLESVRSQGYAIDDEETARGMCCYGTAIVDVSGQVAGAVSVSMVKGAIDDATVASQVDDLRRFGRRLSERLGGPQT